MSQGKLLSGIQTLAALNRGLEQRAYEEAARQRAKILEEQMSLATPSGVLGNSRLADLSDITSYDLLNPRGLFLGAFNGKMLFHSGDGHLLTYARSGAGKGRDLVLPNLAHVRDRSLVVVDVKDGELAYASYQHRISLGQRCIFLNPFGLLGLPNTRINPLQPLIDILCAGGQLDMEADEVAETLLPPKPSNSSNDWVRKGAVRLLALRMEYLAQYDRDNCTLESLWVFLNQGIDDTEISFGLMGSCGDLAIEGQALQLLGVFKDAPKQFEAYRSDAIDALNAFKPGKTLARTTAATDVDLTRLKHEPHTVYLIAPSEKLAVAAPWISLIVNTIIETVAKERGPLRVTFLMDEFPQLPRTPAIMKALRLYRGKNIQLWFIAQGRYSMEERWSREAVKEMEDQVQVFNTTGVEEPSVISDIEKWSGNKTVLMRGAGHNGGTVEAASANLGESKRYVLQSEDIRAIGDGKQIIRLPGKARLIVCDRLPYYTVEPWGSQIRDVRDLHRGHADAQYNKQF